MAIWQVYTICLITLDLEVVVLTFYRSDHISTLAIMSGDKEHRAGVSVQLGTSYMKAIPMNENVKIVSKVLRTGKQLATAEVRFYDKVCVISTYVTIFILSLNLLNGTVLRSIFNALLGQRALRC